MVDDTKKYCVTHHFYYKGEECPFCCSERIQALSKRFCTKEKPKKEASKKPTTDEITQESLDKLLKKFNSK